MIEVLVLFVLPVFIIWLTQKVPFFSRLGAISLCYVVGFILAVLPLPYDKSITETVASVLIALAIPLVLFSFNILEIRKLAGKTLLSFGLVIIVVMLCSVFAAMIAKHAGMENAYAYGGMTTGLYIGGVPNMFAIGKALLKDSTAINAANISDSIYGGIFFMLILTVIHPIYRRFLGDRAEEAVMSETAVEPTLPLEYDFASIPRDKKHILKLIGVIFLAAVCLGIGAVLEILINGDMSGSLYIMITVSVLGIVFSFIRPIREVRGSYQIGQYLILVFSLGLSMSLDLGKLISSLLPTILFIAGVEIAAMIIHMILCKLFRIDGGIALITAIAGFYGPPFIAPTASAYGDRSLIAPGVICGTVGLVVGNILGIVLGSLLLNIL